MTEDRQTPANPEAVSAQESTQTGKPSSVEVTVVPDRYPALLESLSALGLLLVVAYTCWRLYSVEIGRMFTALFR